MASSISGFATPRNLTSASSTSSMETSLTKAAQQNANYLEQAQALYQPYTQAGLSSLNEYVNLLTGGVDSLSNDQNFQSLQNLAEKKVMSNAATSGLLRSGATANTLDDTLLNFANTYYDSRLSQLQSGASMGLTGVNGESQLMQALGTNATDLATALANIQMQREANATTLKAAQTQANATLQAANSTAKAQKSSGIWGGLGTAAAGLALAFSDERLKTDLKLVGKSDNGLNIYLGRYKPESGLDDGKQHLFLIAQEVQKVVPEAVVEGEDGYLRVNYAKALGVDNGI